MMTYEEARAYYKEIAGRGSVLGLEKMNRLMDALRHPERDLRVVHIAGTNGKGSVGAMLATILARSNKRLKIGRYVSPAVFGEREIIQVFRVGETTPRWISEEEYAIMTENVKNIDEVFQIHATPFELQTAMAFAYFASELCDVVLVEVGMGGRLDATNVIERPILSLLTSISMDHMAFLGNDLASIAREKAGIIKEYCPVLTGPQAPEVMAVIEETVKEKHCMFGVAEPLPEDVELSLKGIYQRENAAIAAQAARWMACSEEEIRDGLAHTVWPGRFEVVSEKPCVVLDGAHNEDAIIRLVENVEHDFPGKRVILCMGVFRDKAYEKELQILRGCAGEMVAFTTKSGRALPGEELAEAARKAGFAVTVAEDAVEAVDVALKIAGEDDVIVCCGSLSFLSDIREKFLAFLGER